MYYTGGEEFQDDHMEENVSAERTHTDPLNTVTMSP